MGVSRVSAVGPQARELQSRICQRWAAIPGRARWSSENAFALWNMSAGLLYVTLVAFVVGYLMDFTVTVRALITGAVFLALSIYLTVVRMTGLRGRPKLVTLTRAEPTRLDVWAVISAIASVAAVVVALWDRLDPAS
jgi:hypothetical protein